MKKVLLTLLMSSITICTFPQTDKSDCLDKTFSFFTTFEGFYLQDCEFSEFGSYEFWVDASSRSIKKEGIYRVVWFKQRKEAPESFQDYRSFGTMQMLLKR